MPMNVTKIVLGVGKRNRFLDVDITVLPSYVTEYR